MRQKSPKVRQYRNEINRSAMGLISPVKTWRERERTVDVVVGDRRYKMEARSAYHALPHGIDSDVLTAIITLSLESGLPDHHTLRTTPHELLRTAMMSVSGREYERLRESLLRLVHATYIIRDGWYDAARGRWKFSNETYRLVDKVTWQDEEDLGGHQELVADGHLSLRLNVDLVDQLKAGYVHLPDPTILRALRDAPARGLYAFLEAHRERLRLEGGERPEDLQFELASLAQLLGLGVTSRKPIPGNIRRSLVDMSDALREARYLTDMQIDGRGMKATVRFRFAAPEVQSPLDAELVQTLVDEGLLVASARHLASRYPGNVRRGVQIYREMVRAYAARGRAPRDPRALLAATVRDPARYAQEALVTGEAGVVEVLPSTPVETVAVTATPVPAEGDEEFERAARAEWAALTPDVAARRFVTLMGYARVSCTQGQARMLLERGVDLHALSGAVARAVSRGEDPAALLTAALEGP